jgi:hypothetical protein
METAPTKTPEDEGRGRGRPPVLNEFAQGQLVACLACGLTQRETGMWLQTQHTNVGYLFRSEQINHDVKYCTELARLHPLLRMHQAAGKTWKAAARLLTRLDERQPLTTDELIAGLALMQERVRGAILGPNRHKEPG